MAFRKFRLVPFVSEIGTTSPPTVEAPVDLQNPANNQSDPATTATSPPTYQQHVDVKPQQTDSVEHVPVAPSRTGTIVTEDTVEKLSNQFISGGDKKRAKTLLRFLEKIKLSMTEDGVILYDEQILGSPIFEMVTYLVSDGDGDSRPWDLGIFLKLLKAHKPVPWNFLNKSKENLVKAVPKKQTRKRKLTSPQEKRGRKKSISPMPDKGRIDWRKLF